MCAPLPGHLLSVKHHIGTTVNFFQMKLSPKKFAKASNDELIDFLKLYLILSQLNYAFDQTNKQKKTLSNN